MENFKNPMQKAFTFWNQKVKKTGMRKLKRNIENRVNAEKFPLRNQKINKFIRAENVITPYKVYAK